MVTRKRGGEGGGELTGLILKDGWMNGEINSGSQEQDKYDLLRNTQSFVESSIYPVIDSKASHLRIN